MKPRKIGGPHELLVDAMGEVGIVAGDPTHGVEVAANFLGLSHWTLRKEIDPDQAGELSFVRIVQLVRHFKLQTVAHYFASLAGGMFLPLLPTGMGPKWGELTGQTAEDMGRFTAEMVRDLADGKLTRDEARQCLKIHCELMRHQAELHAMLRACAEGDEV